MSDHAPPRASVLRRVVRATRAPRRRLNQARKRLGVPLAIFVAVLSIYALAMSVAAVASRSGSSASTAVYTAQPEPAKSAEVVRVGIEPISFDGVSVSDETFQTSFYVWWRWRGKIDPVPTTDVLNSTPSSSTFTVSYSYVGRNGQEKPIRLSDGDWYQTARISTGATAQFALGRYPLDHQHLLLRFENNTYDVDQVIYEPDLAHMSPHPQINVAGWQYDTFSMRPLLHQYQTDFGVVGGGAAASRYSQLVYDVEIQRPISHFIIKLLIPLLVVFSAALGALLVKHDEFDIKQALVATGLLTLIFLQQGYTADLPATAPGVLMDYIYIAAYLGVALAFLRTIYTGNKIHHEEDDRNRYIRGDRITAAVLEGAFLLLIGLLILL